MMFLITIFSVLLPLPQAAVAEENICNQLNVHTVQAPIDPRVEHSGSFSFRYQWIEIDPLAPTLIYLPGGPGGTSITDWSHDGAREVRHLGLPERGFNYLLIDPRLEGCNLDIDVPNESVRTDTLASDVLVVIQQLKLDHYFIYGMSYGTLVATVLSDQLVKAHLPLPIAVILVGTMGSKQNSPSILLAEEEFIQSIGDSLSESAFDVLKSLNSENPHPNLPPDINRYATQASLLFSSASYERKFAFKGKVHEPLTEYLAAISANPPRFSDAWNALRVFQYFAAPRSRPSSHSEELNRLIGCREIPFTEFDMQDSEYFKNGSFYRRIPNANHYCSGFKLDHPFNSANYSISVPIVYFQGTADIATLYEGARYHHQHQTASDRYFVRIPGAGHESLGLLFDDCKQQIWNAMGSTLSKLPAALAKCLMPNQIQFTPKKL